MPFVMDKSKIVSEYDQEIPQSQTADNPVAPRVGLHYLRIVLYSTAVRWDIFDLPFVQNKDYQY